MIERVVRGENFYVMYYKSNKREFIKIRGTPTLFDELYNLMTTLENTGRKSVNELIRFMIRKGVGGDVVIENNNVFLIRAVMGNNFVFIKLNGSDPKIFTVVHDRELTNILKNVVKEIKGTVIAFPFNKGILVGKRVLKRD